MNILRRRQQTKPNTDSTSSMIHLQSATDRNGSTLNTIDQYGYAKSKHEYGRRRRRWNMKLMYIIAILILIPILSYWHISIHYIFPATSKTYISSILGFHPEWHPSKRSDRFPSMEERVKLYMSNFYLPPCNSTNDSGGQSVDERMRFSYHFHSPSDKYPEINLSSYSNNREISQLTTKIKPDTPIVLWEDALEPCYFPSFERSYCPDARKIASIAKHIMGKKNLGELPPIIAQFGDHLDSELQKEIVPFIKKFRQAASGSALEKVTNQESGVDCQAVEGRQKLVPLSYKAGASTKANDQLLFSPIVWLLNYKRHYGYVSSVKWIDSPWELKKDMAIWRGLLTGPLSTEEREGKSFKERCDMLPRCRFVRNNLDTPGLDVGVSGQLSYLPIDNDNLNFIKGRKWRITHMRYKAIIIMEGNDISSGLKWALYSRSVIMMPPPTKTSFLMEELLTPWVHYIPLEPDLSDVGEKMNWVIEHDQAARKIAERATLFIHDLLYHEDAEEENRQIQEEILRRYMAFFIPE